MRLDKKNKSCEKTFPYLCKDQSSNDFYFGMESVPSIHCPDKLLSESKGLHSIPDKTGESLLVQTWNALAGRIKLKVSSLSCQAAYCRGKRKALGEVYLSWILCRFCCGRAVKSKLKLLEEVGAKEEGKESEMLVPSPPAKRALCLTVNGSFPSCRDRIAFGMSWLWHCFC